MQVLVCLFGPLCFGKLRLGCGATSMFLQCHCSQSSCEHDDKKGMCALGIFSKVPISPAFSKTKSQKDKNDAHGCLTESPSTTQVTTYCKKNCGYCRAASLDRACLGVKPCFVLVSILCAMAQSQLPKESSATEKLLEMSSSSLERLCLSKVEKIFDSKCEHCEQHLVFASYPFYK